MTRPRSWSRRAKNVALGLVVLAVAIGGLLLAFIMTSPLPGIVADLVVEKPIPEEWVQLPPETESVASVLSWTSAGSLAFVADGRTFGEETYRIDVSPDGATLTSSGRFWFKVVVATVTIAFRQEWAGTPRLEPERYSLHVDAPLGRGYEVRARLEGDEFVSERGGEIATIPVDPERAIVLGMFSTYTLIPARFAECERDGIASFDVLLFGGPGGMERNPAENDVPLLTLRKAGESRVNLADHTLRLDRYELQSPFGDSILYAKGREFLALTAGTLDRPLLVYRADYFPDGFPVPTQVPVQ